MLYNRAPRADWGPMVRAPVLDHLPVILTLSREHRLTHFFPFYITLSLLHCAAAKLLEVEAKKQSLSTLDCPESS